MGIKMSKNMLEALNKSKALEENKTSLFRTPNASDLEENKTEKVISDLKEELATKRKVLLEKASSTKKIDVSRIDSSEELLEELFKNNSLLINEARDKRAIASFLEGRKHGKKDFMYSPPNSNVDLDVLYRNTFFDNGSGIMISGKEKELSSSEREQRGSFDYRITLRNSPNITTEEAVLFVQTLVKEANRRGLNLRAKNYWESDAFIIYCDKEELCETVKMLEELTNKEKYGEVVSNATKHFGPIQPFSASVSDSSYYGISMAHQEPLFGVKQIFKGFYAGAVSTFNEYMESALNTVYDSLLKKYAGNADKITVDEFYKELVNYHKKSMVGYDCDIPLWMNRRNYTEYMGNKVERGRSR